jgi:predicted nucleotidyltransferase
MSYPHNIPSIVSYHRELEDDELVQLNLVLTELIDDSKEAGDPLDPDAPDRSEKAISYLLLLKGEYFKNKVRKRQRVK